MSSEPLFGGVVGPVGEDGEMIHRMPGQPESPPGDEKDEPPEKGKESVRAARKREREKSRRKDLNEGFEHMMELIFRIDPRRKQVAEANSKNCKGKNEETPLLSRVEILSQGIETMERLYLENEERKRVVLHLSRGLLAGGGSNGAALDPAIPLPPPPSMNNMPSSLAASRELERQELLRQMELDAFAASRRTALPPPHLRNDRGRLLQTEAALGLANLPYQRPLPHSLGLEERNSLDRTLGSSNLLSAKLHVPAASRARELGGGGGLVAHPSSVESLVGETVGYQARLNRLQALKDEQEVRAASVTLPELLARNNDSSVPLSGDSIRQAVMRERAIAQAAAARVQGGLGAETSPYEPSSKRLRDSY